MTIDTLSYKEGAQPVHWECDGGTEYDMTEGTRKEVGTEIVLYLNEDSLEFCEGIPCKRSYQQVLLFHAGRDFPVHGGTVGQVSGGACHRDCRDGGRGEACRSRRRRQKKKRKAKTAGRRKTKKLKRRRKSTIRSVFPSAIRILCGRNVPATAPTKNTRSSTARYLWTSRSRFSGFI